MILICTRDEQLARLLRRCVRGAVQVAASLDRCLEVVGEVRPSVLLLDVRAGGNDELAVQRIPWIQRASPLTAVVVVTRSPSPQEIEDLTLWGAYSYVDAVALDVPAQIRSAVSAASASGLGGAASALKRGPRLH